MQYLRSSVINDITPSADGILTYDLPVQPLSHLILTIKALNATDEATIQELLALVTKIQVSYNGRSIIDMSAVDLFALNVALLHHWPAAYNPIATDNATRFISLIIPFGRTLYNVNECYKATLRGELQLALTVDIATSACDGLILQCDAIALPEASPAKHLKCVTSSFTPAATGEDKVPLPLSTILTGVLLWATTVPATTAWTATIDKLELLVDDTEAYYTSSFWETLASSIQDKGYKNQYANVNTAVAVLENHAYLDFDPNGNDDFLLDTNGKSVVEMNITFGDTNVMRILPVELRQF